MNEMRLCDIFGVSPEKMGAAALLGIEKAVPSEEGMTITMEVRPCHMNTRGTVHGGILYTLCDFTVSAYLAYKNIPSAGVDGKINYYRPAVQGDVLTARCTVRKAGKRLSTFFTELTNQQGKLLADAMFTAMHM